MTSVVKKITAVVLCASILAACCPEQQVDERGWPKELVLGLVPALEAETMVENMAPLSDFLEAELGIRVSHFVPQDYTGLVEALGAGRADIGMMPPFATMLGARRYDLEPILISVRRGEVGYRAQWMTNDPDICEQPPVADEKGHLSCRASLDVMRGHTVAFTDANSTSGYLWPVKQLIDYGIDPERDLHELFVGSHDASVIAVYNGDVRFGVAWPARIDAGSPGARWIRTNETVATTSATGMSASSRRRTYVFRTRPAYFASQTFQNARNGAAGKFRTSLRTTSSEK